MSRFPSRPNAGLNNRYSSKDYVLASFMHAKKHAILPITAININPINQEKGEIKLCGETTPLSIIGKGSKEQMQLDKTKFAKETGSEEIDLGSFIEGDDNDKENTDFDDDFIPKQSTRRSSTSPKQDDSQENLTSKSSKPTTICSNSTITHDKNVNKSVKRSSATTNKLPSDSDSSVQMSHDDDEDEAPFVQREKESEMNNDGDMLARLFKKNKPSTKRKKSKSHHDNDSKRGKCSECENLVAEMKKLGKRLERIERVVPAIKHFYRRKENPDSSAANPVSMANIEEINRSIKNVFGVEASQVRGPRERPTIIIRHLFTISNHVHDYRHYMEQHQDILKAFVQSRCPGILDMDQAWLEITKSMASLANDIRKNNRTKLAREMANQPNLSNQQQT